MEKRSTHDYLIQRGFLRHCNEYSIRKGSDIGISILLINNEITSVVINKVRLPNCNTMPLLFSVLYTYGIINEK